MDINKSFEKVFKSYKKGDTISIQFPINDMDEHIGAGAGTVKIIGIDLNELKFENVVKDKSIKVSAGGFERLALVKGLILPETTEIEYIDSHTPERLKVTSAFNMALDYYHKNDFAKAYNLLIEYYLLASNEMLGKYHLILGNSCLMRGDINEAKSFYERWLAVDKTNKDIKVGLGCCYYPIDKQKTIELWKEAGAKEVIENLKFIENNKN